VEKSNRFLENRTARGRRRSKKRSCKERGKNQYRARDLTTERLEEGRGKEQNNTGANKNMIIKKEKGKNNVLSTLPTSSIYVGKRKNPGMKKCTEWRGSIDPSIGGDETHKLKGQNRVYPIGACAELLQLNV
jgi:hypothetical protein